MQDIGSSKLGPLFVTGFPKSGTTLVSRLLSNMRNTQLDNDHFIAWYFLKYVRETYNSDLIHTFRNDQSNPRLLELIKDRHAEFDRLAKAHFASLHSGAQLNCRWGNSAKALIFFYDILMKWWPNSTFVFVLRDPRDVYTSFSHQNWPGHAATKDVKNFSRLFLDYYRRRFLDRVVTVEYDKLIRDPKTLYEAVGGVMPTEPLRGSGATYSSRTLPGPLPEPALDQLYNRAGRWKRELSADLAAEIEKECHEVFQDFNFD